MTEFQRLAYAADEDLSLAGILADWLEENARSAYQARAAVLLRRRWKRWQTVRANAVEADALSLRLGFPSLANDTVRADWSFRRYLRRHFGNRRTTNLVP